MPGHDIIAVGASAGGVEALETLIKGLPPRLSLSSSTSLHRVRAFSQIF